ncbi:MAG: DUF3450 domain-containing protein [Clostridium sp.]|nr:DUF3450 domain-containing protein [Clostridium sp.]
MSLTEDWKAGKLKSGWYFIECSRGEVAPNLWFDDEWDDFRGMVQEVLAPCDYDHFVGLTEKVKSLEERFVDASKTIEDLSSENKHLSDLLANQDKEVERLRDENATGCMDCEYFAKGGQLRQLLKECQDWINWAYVELQEYDEDHKSQEIENILTRINAAIGESEE